MPSRPKVVLDACVLVPQRLCDLLLRLAEPRALYTPIITPKILDEARRVLVHKLQRKWPDKLAARWAGEIGKCFPEGTRLPIDHIHHELGNHPKDWHVLAAAIRAEAEWIVTFNLKDFSPTALSPWGITAVSPEQFLLALADADAQAFADKITEMQGQGPSRSALVTLEEFAPDIIDDLGGSDHVVEEPYALGEVTGLKFETR